jgi:serine/threonine protein kinase
LDNTTTDIADRASVDAARERLQAAVAGRFRIEGLIGRGLFSSVFRATGVQQSGEVAIKLLGVDVGTTPGLQQRLENELRACYRFAGDGVVAALSMDHSETCTFLVMPLMRGGSLDDRLRNREPIPLDEVVEMVSELAATLDRIHASGLTHRGLTPRNILFDERGRASVADIGVSDTLLAAGGITGSMAARARAYSAPEQWRARSVNGRSDQYSLAMIAYDMLTGGKRLTREIIEGIHTIEPIVVLADVPLDRGVPLHVNAALRRALSAGPANRFATATEFAEALAGRAPDSVPGLPTTHLEFRLNRRSRVVTVIGGLLVVMGIAIAADPALRASVIRGWRSVGAHLPGTHRRIEFGIDPSLPLAPSRPEPNPPSSGGATGGGGRGTSDGRAASAGASQASAPSSERSAFVDSTGAAVGDPIRIGLGNSSPGGTPRAKPSNGSAGSSSAMIVRETKSWFRSIMNGTWYKGSSSQSAYIQVAVDRGSAVVTVDGIPRGTTPLTATVDAGHHTVAVHGPIDYEASTTGVNASTGDTVRLSFRSSPKR